MKRKRAKPAGKAKPTGMSEIARTARVSVTTASLALNNHPRVSARTKLRVMQAASTVGYVPNHAARRLARARFQKETDPFDQVGFVFFDRMGSELDGVYLAMLRGAEHQLSKCGAALTFLRVTNEEDREKVARLVKAGWVDGWLVVGDVDDRALELVEASRQSCVVVGGHRCTRPVHCVDVNFTSVGKLAAQHLASLGHRRVSYIGGSMQYEYQWEMLNAFRSAAGELGLDPDEQLIQYSREGQARTCADKVRATLALRPLPTAMVTAEHDYAVPALEVLRQYELQVPGEMSLLGCQIESRTASMPNLTRVEQCFTEVGRAGASLLREIAAQPRTPARQVRISPNLVEKLTCAPPRSETTTVQTDLGSRMLLAAEREQP